MAELTTADVLARFYDELVDHGFDDEYAGGLVEIAALALISEEGLIVAPTEDDEDQDYEDTDEDVDDDEDAEVVPLPTVDVTPFRVPPFFNRY